MAASKALSQKDMGSNKIINLADGTNPQDAATKAMVDAAIAFAVSRANHTGSQLASTISNFDTQVRTSRLDQMAVPTANVAFGGMQATGLADPTTGTAATTKNYVDNSIAGLVSGQVLKGSVRVAVTSAVTLSAPGASLDGVTLSSGDIVLLTAQTNAWENGPYVWTGSAAALTRALNFDVTSEAALGSYWIVREGTKADSFALMTNDTAITLGTTNLTFTFISVAGASVGRATATSPAISGGQTWTVTHNLNSQDVNCIVRRTASPYDIVDVYITNATNNTCTVQPDVSMLAGEYTAIVKY